jgi:hypothetical protein
MPRSDLVVITIIGALVVIALAATAWFFLIQKNYNFVIETSCDPTTEKCFHRDCLADNSCPVDGLEDYGVYRISAKDFATCAGDSCELECKTGAASCVKEECGQSGEDSCSVDPEKSVQ